MILDTLENAAKYHALHPLFSRVFEFVQQADFKAMKSGKHAILGDDLFVIIERVEGRSRENVQLECHRKYIDIQLVLSGVDDMAWRPLNLCSQNGHSL